MIRIGLICPSEVAEKRFLPALKNNVNFEFIGIAVSSKEERFGEKAADTNQVKSVLDAEREKANRILNKYGGKLFHSYDSIISSNDIDAIYIPLPPGLHFYWAKKALKYGKHVLIEKPSTICLKDTEELVKLASERNLAIHENYYFVFHKQLEIVSNILASGEIGDVRLIRIDFGFPMRSRTDFRYVKELGGGALLDAGGYTLKLAQILLGETAEIICSHLNYISEYDVDFYGSATLINKEGDTAQISFGMDNEYRCNLDIWGSKGSLFTGRILTAPTDYEPTIEVKKSGFIEVRKLPKDDAFSSSIQFFYDCIKDKSKRSKSYNQIVKQSELVDDFLRNLK